MPDAFFVSKNTRKRPRSNGPKAASTSKKQLNAKGRPTANGKPKSSRPQDEEIDSNTSEDGFNGIDDLELRASDADEYVSGDEDELETPAQKRLRLASAYLESVKEGLADGGIDAAELDRELITSRLKQDVMEHSGKLHRFIAESLDLSGTPRYLRTRGHRQAVTAAVASKDGKFLFTSGKEGTIIVTELSSGKKFKAFYKARLEGSAVDGKGKGKGKQKASLDSHGHNDEILALAVSDDGKYLASGGKDRKVIVWDLEKWQWLRNFGGHKDTISCLAFRRNSHQLYTGSLDRTLKLFDLSPSVMGYVDTLFGHQDHVVSVSALSAETVVSAGARDRTLRFWKVVDETQLVFRGGGKSKVRELLEGGLDGADEGEGGAVEKEKAKETRYEEGSVDCVAMVDESTFVSGGDSGSLSIWITAKKKPIFTYPLAHGLHEVHSETEGLLRSPRWITALACLPYGDVVASGSWSSDIRLWKLTLDTTQKGPRSLTLTPLATLPAPGVVNALQLLTVPASTVDTYAWLNTTTSTATTAKESSPTPNGISKPSAPAPTPTSGQMTTEGGSKPNMNGTRPAGDTLLVVAGLGRETRLGRWMSLKGDGATNGARVFLIRPKAM